MEHRLLLQVQKGKNEHIKNQNNGHCLFRQFVVQTHKDASPPQERLGNVRLFGKLLPNMVAILDGQLFVSVLSKSIKVVSQK